MSNITPIVWTEEPVEEDDGDGKEDGELSSHGDSDIDELVDVDYNILPRPTHTSVEGVTATDGGSNNVEGIQSMDCNNLDVAGSTNLNYSDDEDSVKNYNSSSDTDSDEPMRKKSFSKHRRHPASSSSSSNKFINPNAFNNPYGVNITSQPDTTTVPLFSSSSSSLLPDGVIDADISSVEQKMLTYQEKRRSKNFNIWSQVLQEEEQSKILEKLGDVDVTGANVVVERGPETYAFKPGEPTNRKRKHELPHTQKKSKSKKRRNDSDLSSTGLSDDDLEYLRNCTSSATFVPSAIHSKEDDCSSSRANDMDGDELDPPVTIQEMQKTIHKLRGRRLSYYMAQQLREHKYQLIVRACEILGKNYCMHMFIKTMKIEQKGGLLIKSKTRRRTPGGVFFYMIRNDDKYPQEKIDLIFELDKQITMKDKQTRVKARLRQGVEKLAKFQHRHEKMKHTLPPVDTNNTKAEGTEDGEVESAESDYEEYNSGESDYGDSHSDVSEQPANIEADDDEQVSDYLELACPTNDLDDL